MIIKPKRLLALGAHTDDIELGCGATLSRLAASGVEICTIAFSRAELSRPEGSPPEALENEYRAAMDLLGIPQERVHCEGLPVRTMSDHRQAILDRLIRVRHEFDPDLILTMGSEDTHQDHQVVHQESIRAFRNRSLLAYHSPWNERVLRANVFVACSEEGFAAKMEMLRCYTSQMELKRPYMQERRVRSTMEFYGQQAGLELAEAFELISASVE